LKTAIALLLDIEKTFDIRFANNIIVENTFRTAGALNEAVQLLLERQAS
jgi:acyl carrier protein